MILQTLDIENNCTGIFDRSSFLFDKYEKILNNYCLAWKHSPILNDERYTYLWDILIYINKFTSIQQFSCTSRFDLSLVSVPMKLAMMFRNLCCSNDFPVSILPTAITL